MFASGRLGVIDLTRNGIYGYDIIAELLGTSGTLRIGYLRETPLMVMTKGQVAHDTVPYFMERFARSLHRAARELRAERARAAPAADHRRRWRRGAAGGAGGDPGAEDGRARRGRGHVRRYEHRPPRCCAAASCALARRAGTASSRSRPPRRLGVRRVRGAADSPPARRGPAARGSDEVCLVLLGGLASITWSGERTSRAPRTAARRVLRLSARRLSAAPDHIRGARAASHRDRGMPLAHHEALSGARDPAGGLRIRSARRRQRHAPDHRHPASRRQRPIACSSARCSRRPGTGPAIRRTSTIATSRRSKPTWRRPTTTASATSDGYGIQRLYTATDREEQVMQRRARRSGARARGLPSVRRVAQASMPTT